MCKLLIALLVTLLSLIAPTDTAQAQCQGLGAELPERRSIRSSIPFIQIDTRCADYIPCDMQSPLWILIGPLDLDEFEGKTASVRLEDSGTVSIGGVTNWTVSLAKDKVCTTLVQLTPMCPETSSIKIYLDVDGKNTWTRVFFVPDGNSVRHCPPGVRFDSPEVDTEEQVDSTYLLPEDTTWHDPMGTQGTSIMTQYDRAMSELKYRERTPLLDKDCEFLFVLDTCYIRARGDTFFRINPSITDAQLQEALNNGTYEVNPVVTPGTIELDLADSSQIEDVTPYVDSLWLSDKPGVYRALCKPVNIRELQSKGYRVRGKVGSLFVPADSVAHYRMRFMKKNKQ